LSGASDAAGWLQRLGPASKRRAKIAASSTHASNEPHRRNHDIPICRTRCRIAGGTRTPCYADDASVIDLSGKRPEVKGQAALKQAFAFLGKVPRDFGVDIVKRVVNGPVVIDLEHVHGLPPGKHAPDSLAVYEVRNGKIARLWFPPSS
jgi:hypothetical protein